MPKCLVDYCHNYTGKKKNYGNIILHVFPTALERIKVWLRSIEQSGQVLENIDEMAVEIQENKRTNVYRVCCEHFTSECYVASGEKKILKKNAVPTIFTPKTKESMKRCTEDPEQKSQDAKQIYKAITDDGGALTQKVLNLTLEIIYLLTGEDYIVVKNNSNRYLRLSSTRDNSPNSLILDSNIKKILDLTNKIIELLTGEVPIRYEDITVSFTMEEWEYIEGHKDLYKDVIMEDHQPLTSPGGPCNETPPHIWEPCSDYKKIDKDFSIQFNGRQFRKECHNATRNVTKISCDNRGAIDQVQHSSLRIKEGQGSYEGVTEFEYPTFSVKEELCPDDEEGATDNTYSCASKGVAQQHPHTNIKEEPWDGGEYASNSYMPTDHTYYMTTHVKEDPFSCNEENVLDYNIDTQQCPTTYIKEEPVSYDGVNLTDPNIDIPIDHTYHPSTHIKEEPDSYDGVNLTDPNMHIPTHHTYHLSTYIKEEPDSCDGVNLTDLDIDIPIDPTYHPSTHIKEEPDSYDGVNLTDPNIHEPIHHTYYPSTHIKEEPDSYDGINLTDPNIHEPIHHTYYPSTHIKEKPDSYDGVNLTDPNIHEPIHHTYYPSTHIKEEPDSYDGVNLTDPNIHKPIHHTYHPSTTIKEEPDSYDGVNLTGSNIELPNHHTYHPSTHIKEEPDTYDGVNLTGSSIDLPNHHTYHPSTHIKEEPDSCDGVNLTDPNIDKPIHHTYHPSTYIKEEPDSYNGENIIDLDNSCPPIKKESVSWDGENVPNLNNYTSLSHTQQYPSTPTKVEPVSCNFTETEYTTVFSKEDNKDVLDKTYSCTPRNPIQQSLSTGSKIETTVKWSHTGEKPNSSSLVRNVVIAHLLEMKQGNTNNPQANSPSQACIASTSTVKHEVQETRLEHSSLKNGPGSTQRIYIKKRPTKEAEGEKTFGDISNLTKYLRANSKKKTPQCSQCGQYFLRKTQLEAHVRIHAGQNPFECVDCGKCFLNNDQLVEHQKTHSGGFTCSVCEKSFQKESSLLKHQKIHKGEKPFQCPECGKCFSIYYELHVHKKTHTEDKKYKCSKCGKSYSSKVQFDVHMRSHTGERPYGCTGCGRRFMEKKKLLIHQKLHAGLTPHECPECGKRFALRSNLIIHRRIHSGRKPAVCFQCGKSFSTRSSLIRHIVTHSKLRQCSILDLEKNQQTDSAECKSVSPNSREVLLEKGRRMQK